MLAYKFDSLQAAHTYSFTQTKFQKIDAMRISEFISYVFLVSMSFLIPNSFHFCMALAGNETDRLALLEIKARITDDPFGVMSSWNENRHFCRWQGVICRSGDQRVSILALNSSKLAGSISPHVGNLSFLRVILLYNNSLSHVIPPEIGHLRRLQVVRLENNSLSGEIPSNLSACSELLEIDVSYNLLVGRIPDEFGSLSKLIVLTLSINSLTGSVPFSFGNLSSLEYLSAYSNHLSGIIPDVFGQLTNLTSFNLDGNRLSGVIPPSIFNLSSMTFFSVQVNKIQGRLPTNLGMFFPNIDTLRIGHNQFTGSIPVSISNASNLNVLTMSKNQLYGTVPSLEKLHRLERLVLALNLLGKEEAGDLSFLCDLTNATRLEILSFSVNHFGGVLPQCTANLSSSLLYFYADGNKISGSIPNGMGNLLNLQMLNLYDNQFLGHIPPDFGKLQNLVELAISNSLSGNIPSSFGNLSQLNKLYLDGNRLQGNIPSSLSECQYLQVLVISDNNLSGIIPPELFGLSSLYILDISQNNLTGSLPIEIGHLINLEYLNISGNMLSGEIPASLGSCIKMESLSMQGNFFQGTIPSTLASLGGIQELYLSHNNLSGTIPEYLEQFKYLQYLDLSFNNFEGMVPSKGVFRNVTGTSVEGNSKLCGGIPEFRLPKCKFQHPKKREMSRTLKLVISLVCGILGVTSAFTVLCLYCLKQREKKKPTSSSDSKNFLKLSYQALVKATDGFSSANLIGEGSFGSVFKGVLDEGETTIAVKVLNLARHGASKSFLAECEALRNIRHRNLLKVLSACSGVDHHGDDFKALIYEFMSNGSLDEWLHPTQIFVETLGTLRHLSFSQRLNIAIDVSMALDYLHHHCEQPIVHCDLKPSNILLNDEMVGHVGDFGLVRFLPKTYGDQSSSMGVKGTVGYAPPEHGMGNEVSIQGDVYSYGILLLEIFTGKRPTDEMFQGTSNLHNLVKAALPERVVDIVDPNLVQGNVEDNIIADKNANVEDNNKVFSELQESLISILEVGLACSAESPRERMDIKDAMARLRCVA